MNRETQIRNARAQARAEHDRQCRENAGASRNRRIQEHAAGQQRAHADTMENLEEFARAAETNPVRSLAEYERLLEQRAAEQG